MIEMSKLTFVRSEDYGFDYMHDYKYDVFVEGEDGGYLCTIHRNYRKHGKGWSIDNGGILNERNNWFDTLAQAKTACTNLEGVYILGRS
jgi:hypothetical protein